MGKAEKGTPKHLANKMKSKGLQKLRWYCQMCQKQCRDENGFKCHTTSESHQRQLLLFADNPRRYLDEFSKEFSDGYLELLRRRFGTKRVFANAVYQEYISHKEHLHMNATKWLSLAGFVKWLGKTGKCIVDETEKGWYITYIDRDPDTIARQKALEKKHKMDLDDEERLRDFIEKQVERAKETEKTEGQKETLEFKREAEDEVIKLDMKLGEFKPKVPTLAIPIASSSNVFKMPDKSWSTSGSVKSFASDKDKKKKLTALEELRMEEELQKVKMAQKRDYWLQTGIIVKVVTNQLGDKYHKKKGEVIEVINKYSGIVKMLDTGARLKLDQRHLETVIPSEGKELRVLNGRYRGSKATLVSVQMNKFSLTIEVLTPFGKETLSGIPYEDVSKLA